MGTNSRVGKSYQPAMGKPGVSIGSTVSGYYLDKNGERKYFNSAKVTDVFPMTDVFPICDVQASIYCIEVEGELKAIMLDQIEQYPSQLDYVKKYRKEARHE